MKYWSQQFERWRHEPEPRRERRAFFMALGFTTCLFVLWLASFRLSTSFRSQPTTNNTASVIITPTKTVSESGIIERIKVGWRRVIK